MSRKILELAREQQDEVNRELGEDDDWEDEDNEPEPSSRARAEAGMDSDDDEEFEDGSMSGGEEEAELVGITLSKALLTHAGNRPRGPRDARCAQRAWRGWTGQDACRPHLCPDGGWCD